MIKKDEMELENNTNQVNSIEKKDKKKDEINRSKKNIFGKLKIFKKSRKNEKIKKKKINKKDLNKKDLNKKDLNKKNSNVGSKQNKKKINNNIFKKIKSFPINFSKIDKFIPFEKEKEEKKLIIEKTKEKKLIGKYEVDDNEYEINDYNNNEVIRINEDNKNNKDKIYNEDKRNNKDKIYNEDKRNNKDKIYNGNNTDNENKTNNDNYNNSLRFLKNITEIDNNKKEKEEFLEKDYEKRINKLKINKKNNLNPNEVKKNIEDNNGLNKVLNSINNVFDRKKNNSNQNGLDLADEKKIYIGGAIFGIIIIMLIFTGYYFFFYSPFQSELSNAKTLKLNELNSLYKGPLLVDSNAMSLKSEIENAKTPEEVNSIDILRPATVSWRNYHNRQINIVKDNFSRVMGTYTLNNEKNIIMNVDKAHTLVNSNDGQILSNIEFKTPDTVIIPLLISRLQSGGGLISIGSVVDLYFINLEEKSQQSSNGNSSTTNESNMNSENQNNNNNMNNDNMNNDNMNKNNNTENDNNNLNSVFNENKNNDNYPVISGATVLAILRSKNSGSIDANYIKTYSNTKNEIININEEKTGFSTDVEQLLQSIAAGGLDDSLINGILNNYGIKLSQYERESNIADLEVEYLILLEVPRSDVNFILNNMENLILTVPSNDAPSWMINELKNVYNK